MTPDAPHPNGRPRSPFDAPGDHGGRPRPPFAVVPVTLAGREVRLEPLRLEHAHELFAAGAGEPELWRYLGRPAPASASELADYVRRALDEQAAGRHLPWLTRRARDGRAIGTTRYAHLDPANRSVEIGWTFLVADARRTAANTEAKLLQLRHAFETLGALRVWLQTDERNERSRRAIERLGAGAEGVRRRDRILHDGVVRSSAVYAFTDLEWPAARARLEALLRGVVS